MPRQSLLGWGHTDRPPRFFKIQKHKTEFYLRMALLAKMGIQRVPFIVAIALIVALR